MVRFAFIFSVVNDVISKYVSINLHSFEVSFFRFAFSALGDCVVHFKGSYNKKSLTKCSRKAPSFNYGGIRVKRYGQRD